MPQARADLSEMFPNGDAQAFNILGKNFVNKAGMIRPVNGHIATPQELVALEYLCDEWDYSYDLTEPEANSKAAELRGEQDWDREAGQEITERQSRSLAGEAERAQVVEPTKAESDLLYDIDHSATREEAAAKLRKYVALAVSPAQAIIENKTLERDKNAKKT